MVEWYHTDDHNSRALNELTPHVNLILDTKPCDGLQVQHYRIRIPIPLVDERHLFMIKQWEWVSKDVCIEMKTSDLMEDWLKENKYLWKGGVKMHHWLDATKWTFDPDEEEGCEMEYIRYGTRGGFVPKHPYDVELMDTNGH